ncbi:MAG: hypothetical protein JXA21_07025 [Anaerolineae bacterium]|nr:hypothetical protein [Anaerolineae bacterium]
MNLQTIATSKTQLNQALGQLGVLHITCQSTELVVKKGQVVGYVLSFSWDATVIALDVGRLLEIVKQAGGYGTLKSEATAEHTIATLQVSFSLS